MIYPSNWLYEMAYTLEKAASKVDDWEDRLEVFVERRECRFWRWPRLRNQLLSKETDIQHLLRAYAWLTVQYELETKNVVKHHMLPVPWALVKQIATAVEAEWTTKKGDTCTHRTVTMSEV